MLMSACIAHADVDEEVRELQEQLEEEVEYSTELYERAQLAEAELTTLRASMATTKVSWRPSPVCSSGGGEFLILGIEAAKTCR